MIILCNLLNIFKGQPNRQTGVCDDDVFIMGGKKSYELKLCGHNTGQHGNNYGKRLLFVIINLFSLFLLF